MWSDVFFCKGGFESVDSFLLWQITEGFNEGMNFFQMKLQVIFSKTILPDTCRHAVRPLFLLFPIQWGTLQRGRRRRVEVKRKWRKRSVGVRGLFSNWRDTFELNWIPWEPNSDSKYQCDAIWAAMQTLTLAEEDEGEKEEEVSERLGLVELSWCDNQSVWEVRILLCTQNLNHKHAPQHAWPLFLYFQWRPLSRRRGGPRSVRARLSGAHVFNFLPEQMSQQ